MFAVSVDIQQPADWSSNQQYWLTCERLPESVPFQPLAQRLHGSLCEQRRRHCPLLVGPGTSGRHQMAVR